jgi:hypothetical protein
MNNKIYLGTHSDWNFGLIVFTKSTSFLFVCPKNECYLGSWRWDDKHLPQVWSDFPRVCLLLAFYARLLARGSFAPHTIFLAVSFVPHTIVTVKRSETVLQWSDTGPKPTLSLSMCVLLGHSFEWSQVSAITISFTTYISLYNEQSCFYNVRLHITVISVKLLWA